MNIVQQENVLTYTSTSKPSYKYLHVTQQVTMNEIKVYEDIITMATSIATLQVDGYFIISEIGMTTIPGSGYYIDGMVVRDSAGNPLTTEEVLAIDPNTTNIDRLDTDWVSVYFLSKFYMDYVKSKFLKNICSCGCLSMEDKLIMDALSMGLTLVDHLVKSGLHYEAQRIIEQMFVCAGMTTDNCNCYG